MVSSFRGVHACGISAHLRAKRIPMGQGIVQPVTLGWNWPGSAAARIGQDLYSLGPDWSQI